MASSPGFTVQAIAGSDLLRRRGDVVLLVSTAGADDAVDRLLDVVDGAAEEPVDGRKLIRRLANHLAGDDADPPSFVVLVPAGESMAVLVHGDADAVVEVDGSSETLSGRTAAAWVDRVVPWPAAIRAVISASASDPPVPRSDLRDGAVAAGGFVVAAASAPAAAQPAATPAEEQVHPESAAGLDLASTTEMPVAAAAQPAPDDATPEFESILLLPGAEDDGPREPLPLAGTTTVTPPDAVIVKGIRCKRDHFNSPKAAFCGVCGISMVQQTHELVDGPRPPLGVIVFDDGTTFGLDADYVIGREPEIDGEVSSGQLRGLTIDDPENSVSRVHALIKLDGWEVLIVDRGSANGTRVASTADGAWTSLTPNEPALIQPGTKVQLGGRTLTFDAHFRV